MGAYKWYEVTCDNCGSSSHYGVGIPWREQAKEDGYIVKGKLAFCDDKCLKKFKDTVKPS